MDYGIWPFNSGWYCVAVPVVLGIVAPALFWKGRRLLYAAVLSTCEAIPFSGRHISLSMVRTAERMIL